MKASQLIAVAVTLVVAALLAGADAVRADVPDTIEISGVVQDWRVDPAPGYMVVGGVRYEFGDDFALFSEGSQLLPKDIVRVGAQIRFWSNNDGVVDTVILLSDGNRQ